MEGAYTAAQERGGGVVREEQVLHGMVVAGDHLSFHAVILHPNTTLELPYKPEVSTSAPTHPC